jgi:asparagine synthase (glutamine-hydrolysing)
MCGIAGIYHLKNGILTNLENALNKMSYLLQHRGPDGQGKWINTESSIGLAHQRLSIIDLSQHANQPMVGQNGIVITFNGEIYNHIELRQSLSSRWDFYTSSDTEVILAAYAVYGLDCVKHLKGMFSFAIWDGTQLFCARDHFGIKPFYYSEINDVFYFASETKALLPFLPSISTHPLAFNEYMTFQYPLGPQTLFEGIQQLEPAHAMVLDANGKRIWRYWDVNFEVDHSISEEMCYLKLSELLDESIKMHMRADVPIAAYVSGGIDSSLIGILATQNQKQAIPFFHGRFLEDIRYDESTYAHHVAEKTQNPLFVKNITANEFQTHIDKIMYHMDFPVAGPGVFPQYMVSELAAKTNKVILGGQGGDEIFGGYARYLIAFFEQCLKAEIEGRTSKHFNLGLLSGHLELLEHYKPMMKQFWQKGLFDSFEQRYYQLIDRSHDFSDAFILEKNDKENCYQNFQEIFDALKFSNSDACFNAMLNFDMKTSLPGLLHVEDRVSMAHGLESRVPFLYWPLVEFLATLPIHLKFKNGQMKSLLLNCYQNELPESIRNRKDKMGFPVPLTEWMHSELKEFMLDILISGKNRSHSKINYDSAIRVCETEGVFSRKIWGLFCLELWQQQFHDKQNAFKSFLNKEVVKI